MFLELIDLNAYREEILLAILKGSHSGSLSNSLVSISLVHKAQIIFTEKYHAKRYFISLIFSKHERCEQDILCVMCVEVE